MSVLQHETIHELFCTELFLFAENVCKPRGIETETTTSPGTKEHYP